MIGYEPVRRSHFCDATVGEGRHIVANNIDTVGFVRTKEARVQDCLEVVNGQKHYSDRLLVGEFRQGLAHVDTLVSPHRSPLGILDSWLHSRF